MIMVTLGEKSRINRANSWASLYMSMGQILIIVYFGRGKQAFKNHGKTMNQPLLAHDLPLSERNLKNRIV